MRGFLELLAVGVARALQQVGQAGLLALLCGLAVALGRADVVLRHLHAHLLGQILHRLDKAHARVFHQKTDGIAVLAAAKAVIELFGWTDAEGR